MIVDKIMLEITRNCDLVCEHCCRGEKEVVNMSIETIDNIFKTVGYVDELFLTGGEPLIAINQLEHIADLMMEGKIYLGKLSFITNATVMSSRVLTVLKKFQMCAVLDIRLSSDIFHVFELERLGLLEKRDENIKVFKELFGLKTHTSTNPTENKHMTRGLMFAGRAKKITQERLDEINKTLPFNYMISKNFTPNEMCPQVVSEDEIKGTIYVDVNGFIVSTRNPEFKVEDAEALETNINVNDMNIRDAVNQYYNQYEEKRKAMYAKLLGR